MFFKSSSEKGSELKRSGKNLLEGGGPQGKKQDARGQSHKIKEGTFSILTKRLV